MRNRAASLAVWSLFARLPYNAAAGLWSAILLTSLLGLVATVLCATTATIGPVRIFAAFAIAIGFGPITSDLALGQLALPAFVGAALVAVTAQRSLPVATASACIAFAQPNLALGLISRLGRPRVVLALLLAAAIIYALGSLYGGPVWIVAYTRILRTHGMA